MEYSSTLSHLTARSNDQQTILHAETDRTNFLTWLGPEVLPAALAQCKVK
jgi:hypothetical protein